MGLLKNWLAERKERKQAERKMYARELGKAKGAKERKEIRKQAYMMAGYKPTKKGRRGKRWAKQKQKTSASQRIRSTFFGAGREAPSFGREERYASLMGEHRGMSIADYGMGEMGTAEKKKKKRGFSLANW